MVINRANMDALFTTYNTAFSAAMKTAAGRAYANMLILEDFALSMNVQGAATVHAWLSQIKAIHEWIGDRIINNIKLGKLTITNRSFENTIGVPRKDIEDDQYGQFAPLLGALGSDAESLWIKLGIAALTGNGTWADGNPFFCKTRLMGDSGAITNAVTTALSKTAVETALTTIRSWKLDGGEPADVMPENLIVGPSLEGTAKAIIEADIEANAAGTLAVSNVSTARMLKLRVDSRLIGDHASKWFVTCRKGGIPAVVVQKRKLPILTRMDRDTDQNVFMSDNYYYGTDARGEAFLSLPFLAYLGGASSVATWDSKLAG